MCPFSLIKSPHNLVGISWHRNVRKHNDDRMFFYHGLVRVHLLFLLLLTSVCPLPRSKLARAPAGPRPGGRRSKCEYICVGVGVGEWCRVWGVTSPRVAARSPPSVVTLFSLPLLFFCLGVGSGVGGCLGRRAVRTSVREHVRVRACPWALGRMAVGISASCRLDSRRMAWRHFTR